MNRSQRLAGALGLALGVALALAAGPAAAQSLTGRYTVSGENPDGTPYSGTARITETATACTVEWETGDEPVSGACRHEGNQVTATYSLDGDAGRATYTVTPDGTLSGPWSVEGTDGAGTETLTPVKTAAAPARADDAASFVRGLYTSDPIFNPLADDETDPRLTGPARAAIEENRRQSEAGDGAGCIDFVVSVSAQDWDDATVRKTLKLATAPSSDPAKAVVTATLTAFAFEGVPDDQQTTVSVEYDLRRDKGGWRIFDMAAREAGKTEELWRLSALCR